MPSDKYRVGILLENKYARFVTATRSVYEDRIMKIKLEEIEWCNVEIACVYASNIPIHRRYIWHILLYILRKNCKWIIGGDFNMTERPENKLHDCGRAISDLKIYIWKELLNTLQVSDKYVHQWCPRFSWDDGQNGISRRLARLDRFYTLVQNKLDIFQAYNFIYGYSVRSDHFPVHLVLHIGSGEGGKNHF